MEIEAAASLQDQTNSLFSTESSKLGKDEFLKLFVEQLSNQDPLDPLKNEDFIAQMATFSQLEQTTNMNTNLTSYLETQTNLLTGQALAQYAGLIGKSVVAQNSDSERVSGEVKSVAFDNGSVSIQVNGIDIPVENIIEVSDKN